MKKVIVCAMFVLSTNAMAFSLGDVIQAGQEVSGAALSVSELKGETQAQRIDRQMAEAEARDEAALQKDRQDGKNKKHINVWGESDNIN